MIKASYLFSYLLSFLVVGCASLPQVTPISEDNADAARQSFSQMLGEQWSCPAVLDADVSLTFNNFVYSGTIPGYLQAMRPSFLRFEGINPFGLTETVLVTDGVVFSYVVTREEHGYEGDLRSKVATDYIPAALSNQTSYYWLIGKLPPGRVVISNAGRDIDSKNVWFDIKGASGSIHKILYSEKEKLVLRHLALDNAGEVEVDVSYSYPENSLTVPLAENCLLPQQLDIKTKGSTKITIGLTKIYPADEINQDQFLLEIPANYKRTVVK